MKKIINKNKFLSITLGLVLILVISAVIALSVRLGQSQTYTSLTSNDYVVGTLDETGVFAKDGGCIVTEEYYSIEGMKVEVKEDAELSYKLYFYDENKEFISATSNYGVNYNGVIPETAEYFKITINPTNDSDISQFDIINYSNQVSVKYYK